MSDSNFAPEIARRLCDARNALTARWLERIVARVTVPAREVFPTDDLLDHIPLLIEGIAAFVHDRAEVIPADSVVSHHARALGELRYRQGFSEYEVLKEFEILGGILFAFVGAVAEELEAETRCTDLVAVSARLFQSVALVQQATTGRFLELAHVRIAEREDRLRTFQRALSHEMRNRIGATLGAGQLLQDLDLASEQRTHLAGVVVRNADNLRLILENLLELARLDDDARGQRRVLLSAAVFEASRQLRDLAASRNVAVLMVGELPAVEVNAAAVELCTINLISNAIKYSDPLKQDRWVRISGSLVGAGESQEVLLVVDDNGIGIPAEAGERLFERFFRASSAVNSGIEGTGLGLHLVRETVEAINGRVWLDTSVEHTRFAIALPCRRATDAASVGRNAVVGS
ncbi:MAG TPA: HAMP domain-containing sensor histidine kinase [Gemmatimonadaceae bacterium]|jgi:signal transduction histidine kinase